MKKFYIPQ